MQAGSREAFDRLAGDLFKPLWRFVVYRMGVPKQDVEELVQDVLMKVYLRVGTFSNDGRAKLTTWITQIAKRKAIDFHRARSRKFRKFEELTEDIQPVDADGRPASHQITYLERFMDGLEKLPIEDQQILSWRDKGFTYTEIAKWLGIGKRDGKGSTLACKEKAQYCGRPVRIARGCARTGCPGIR